MEQYRPFYMEDPLSPEDVGWFQIFRQETSAPLAMGELFVNRNEWLSLVANRWIDFIRIHQSSVGGLNMCRKVAHCCEFFDVRTAWHGPNNVDPVGHCYNLHLNLVTPNFGIQEETFFDEKTREVFPGTPEIRKGYIYCNEKPGFGIDIDRRRQHVIPTPRTLRSGETIACWMGLLSGLSELRGCGRKPDSKFKSRTDWKTSIENLDRQRSLGAPHSLVFGEMWDTASFNRSSPRTDLDSRVARAEQWYPTSRQKRARYGAPVVGCQDGVLGPAPWPTSNRNYPFRASLYEGGKTSIEGLYTRRWLSGQSLGASLS